MIEYTWHVTFEIEGEDGSTLKFWDLPETEQEVILKLISNDFYSGTIYVGGDDE